MATTSAPVGIIIPPPEIRNLCDITAPHVAKVGQSFEDMVMERESHNPQFSFIKQGDPYRAYFDHKVAEIKKQLEIEKLREEAGIVEEVQINEQNRLLASTLDKKGEQQNENQQENEANQKQLKAPEPDLYTVIQPKGLSVLEIDMIKYCAQFVAQNGKKFLVALTERERQNPQYDFLKPTNDLYPYFQALTESYIKCINIKKSSMEEVINHFKDKTLILNKCGEIFEYKAWEESQRQKKDQQDELENEKMAAIDWNDFVVVETIDFVDEDDFYEREDWKPDNIDERQNDNIVIKQSSQVEEKLKREKELQIKKLEEDRVRLEKERQELKSKQAEADKKLQEIKKNEQKMELEKEIKGQIVESKDNDLDEDYDKVVLKQDYIPKTNKNLQQKTKCQNCNKMIPINEMEEHLKIELMSQEAREQKSMAQQRAEKISINEGQEMSQYLTGIKRKRPDIFGQQEEDLVENVLQEEEQRIQERQEKKIHYDGQAQNMSRTTGGIAMMQHLERKKNEELSKKLNLRTVNKANPQDVASSMPQQINIPTDIPQYQQYQQPPSLGKGGQNQQTVGISQAQQKTKDGYVLEEGVGLQHESTWVDQHPTPVKINIRIPDIPEEGKYNLIGQTIQLTLPPSTTILHIKIQLAAQLNNLPASRQKIKSSLFASLREEKTIGFYNTLNNATFELQLL